MLAYFGGESANGQKFCDMLLRQVSLYKRNRQKPALKNSDAADARKEAESCPQQEKPNII